MRTKQNPPKIWDAIWMNSTELNSNNLALLIEDAKKSETWKNYTKIVEENLGGWHKVNSVEIGAGMGWHSLLAASEGANVCLLDYSQKALELAKQRFQALNLNGSFIYGDAFDLAITMKESFNLAWSFGTAEHFQDPFRQKFFDLHFDLLNKGGVSIISCPHAYAINYRIWMFFAKKYNEWEFGLEVPYTKKEFLYRLENTNQKLINVIYDEGRPCLQKVLNILKRNNKALYILLMPVFRLSIKNKINIHPINKRSIILIAEKSS